MIVPVLSELNSYVGVGSIDGNIAVVSVKTGPAAKIAPVSLDVISSAL